MEWHKVEDYPVGSDEYVLVSSIICNKREDVGCFVAMLKDDYWQDEWERIKLVQSTDRWCHIDLSED